MSDPDPQDIHLHILSEDAVQSKHDHETEHKHNKWSTKVSAEIGVFKATIWTKSFIWPISTICTPPWYTWLESYEYKLFHGIFKKK